MKTLGIVLLAIVIVGLIVYGPIFTIWSLNSLFGLSIPVSLKTWASTFWLVAIVGGAGRRSKKGDN